MSPSEPYSIPEERYLRKVKTYPSREDLDNLRILRIEFSTSWKLFKELVMSKHHFRDQDLAKNNFVEEPSEADRGSHTNNGWGQE